MLVVGIILKNVPYNFGQFGRAECTPDGHNASFADSIHDFDKISEHSSFKRSIPDTILAAVKIQPVLQGAGVRRARSVSGEAAPEEDTGELTDCHPKYIGHELDPLIARQVARLRHVLMWSPCHMEQWRYLSLVFINMLCIHRPKYFFEQSKLYI